MATRFPPDAVPLRRWLADDPALDSDDAAEVLWLIERLGERTAVE